MLVYDCRYAFDAYPLRMLTQLRAFFVVGFPLDFFGSDSHGPEKREG
jgi:hypothetical protein